VFRTSDGTLGTDGTDGTHGTGDRTYLVRPSSVTVGQVGLSLPSPPEGSGPTSVVARRVAAASINRCWLLDKHYPGGASISGQRRHRCEIGRRPGQIDQCEMYEGAYTGDTRADDLRHSRLSYRTGWVLLLLHLQSSPGDGVEKIIPFGPVRVSPAPRDKCFRLV
jgi:hypothetical protein